jgi:HemY protein
MTRTLWFCLKVAILVGVAWYLAERQPGQVSLEGWGYRIDTSVGILLLAAGLVAVLAAIVYRSWGGIKRTPGDIGRKLAANREKRGYRALTQGMVAVAAGEAGEAQRWARKADELLDAPPLTMLLSAQAAQLDGDHQAAKRYFNAMLERDETRFLGLRGLITQALRDGDEPAALEYVRSAHTLRPNTPWVLETLFDLSEQAGDLEEAERAAREAAQGKVLPAPEAKRKHAVVLLERAYKAQHAGDPNQTLKLVKQARKAAPDLVPASVLHAELLVGSGRRGTAARMLERAWGAAPHPALIEPYRAARPGKTEIEWLNQVGKLTGPGAIWASPPRPARPTGCAASWRASRRPSTATWTRPANGSCGPARRCPIRPGCATAAARWRANGNRAAAPATPTTASPGTRRPGCPSRWPRRPNW